MRILSCSPLFGKFEGYHLDVCLTRFGNIEFFLINERQVDSDGCGTVVAQSHDFADILRVVLA